MWDDVHAISNTTRGVGGPTFKVLRLKGNNKIQMLIFVAGKTTAELNVFWTEGLLDILFLIFVLFFIYFDVDN